MIYKITKDKQGKNIIMTNLKGKALMFHPLLNKSNAFTAAEREAFCLEGKLPPVCETLETQTERAYQQYLSASSDEAKSIFLHVLYNTNEILFYALIRKYINEITAKLYTPTVSMTVQHYSLEYRHPRGIFISYKDKDKIKKILANRTNQDLDLVVISDGEAILGIGDQGIGGMGIPVAKAAMHVAAGTISPYKIAPIFLDVGTNKSELRNDDFYLGIREERKKDEDYKNFVKTVINEIYDEFPNVVMHFEDFSKINARWLMDEFGKRKRCFNDDIQGTAAIVLAAIMTALRYKNECISQQRIVLVGPGAAGMGIVESIQHYLKMKISKDQKAEDQIWLVGRDGLITSDNCTDDEVKGYAKSLEQLKDWQGRELSEVVKRVKPTILIGVTGQGGLFSDEILTTLIEGVDSPVILPLSNPSLKSECIPERVMEITDNKVFIATGSPFTVQVGDKRQSVSQCNNIFAFPGLAAGMYASKCHYLSQDMIIAASNRISKYTIDKHGQSEKITPELEDLQEVSKEVAEAVLLKAVESGLSPESKNSALKNLAESEWRPEYYEYLLSENMID